MDQKRTPGRVGDRREGGAGGEGEENRLKNKRQASQIIGYYISLTSDSEKKLALATDRALDILGEQSKEYLLYYMSQHHGIRFDNNNNIDSELPLSPPTVDRIENALTDILGAGAIPVIFRLRAELATR